MRIILLYVVQQINMMLVLIYSILFYSGFTYLPSYLSKSSESRYFEGKYYAAETNLTNIFKQQKTFLVIFTLRFCTSCYQNQSNIKKSIKYFQEQFHIKIFRCELASSPQLQKKYQIFRFPYIILFQDSRPIPYKSIFNLNSLILFYSLFLKSFTHLNYYNSPSQLDNLIFLNKSQYQSVLLFFGLISKFKKQIELLKKISSQKNQMQTYYYVISNQITIKQSKKNHPQWFLEKKQSSLILFRFIKRSFYYQIINISQYIESNLLSRLQRIYTIGVKEFSKQIYEMIKNTNKPVFICIIDSIYQIQKSWSILEMLESILEYFHKEIYIFWVEGAINNQKKKMLGFSENDIPPLLSIFQPFQQKKRIFGKQQQFNQQNIINFIENNLKKQQKSQNLANFIMRRSNGNIELQSKNYFIPKKISIIFCLSHISGQQIQTLAYFKKRLYKYFYKSIELILFEHGFFYQNKFYKQGLYIFGNSTIQNFQLNFQCEYLFSKISNYIEIPEFGCIQQHLLPQYLEKIMIQ